MQKETVLYLNISLKAEKTLLLYRLKTMQERMLNNFPENDELIRFLIPATFSNDYLGSSTRYKH